MGYIDENTRNSRLSFTFEFRSPVRRRDLASKLSKNLGKKVKWFKGVNESFKASDSLYKLSNKYSEFSKTLNKSKCILDKELEGLSLNNKKLIARLILKSYQTEDKVDKYSF